MAQEVHAGDPAHVLMIDRDEPHEGRDADEQDDRQDEEREGDEALVERGGLGDQGQCHDRSREHRQEHRGAAERLVPAQRPRGQEAPVLRREDLESQRRWQVAPTPDSQHVRSFWLSYATATLDLHRTSFPAGCRTARRTRLTKYLHARRRGS